jgi:AraC-like DNA-binding protein
MLVFEFIIDKNAGLSHLLIVMNFLNICSVSLLVSTCLFPNMLYSIIFKNVSQPLGRFINLVNKDFGGSLKRDIFFKVIGEKLDLYFFNKPYLQEGFNMSNVAKDTNISYNQIALFYRIYLQVSFSEWKNSVRIEHAVELLQNGECTNLTLEAISIKCGYRTRANFIKVFNDSRGEAPSVYLKRLNMAKNI